MRVRAAALALVLVPNVAIVGVVVVTVVIYLEPKSQNFGQQP